jgi:diacylglycerol kinase family enzyme
MAATGAGVTTSPPPAAPSALRRLAAVAALVALLLAVLFLVVAGIRRWEVLLVSIGSLAVAVAATWLMLSRRGTTRAVAAVALAAALVLFVAVVLASESVQVVIVSLVLATVGVVAAEQALHGHADRDAVSRAPAQAAAPPQRPVLIMNLRSGGGKAERFDLVGRCREQGVEPVVLREGDDLLALAEDAVARGADVIGMAGGDGSQALVASVASRHGLPFVVVPAGTRNHFALDLGLDREDVPGAFEAYSNGVDVVVDIAELNGRPFVNNASMGVYAQVVQSPEYRDAKVRTAAAILPDVLGPEAVPPDLRFPLPTCDEATTTQLLLVSNNPYQLSRLRGGGTRERLDAGVLGVVSVHVRGAADAEQLAALEAAGQVRRFAGWQEWTTTELEVRSSAPVEVGVDGEALLLNPPLRFAIRPGALTIRLPRSALTRPRPRQPVRVGSAATLAALWRTALGRPVAPR